MSRSRLHYPRQTVCEYTVKHFQSDAAEPIIQAAWRAALS